MVVTFVRRRATTPKPIAVKFLPTSSRLCFPNVRIANANSTQPTGSTQQHKSVRTRETSKRQTLPLLSGNPCTTGAYHYITCIVGPVNSVSPFCITVSSLVRALAPNVSAAVSFVLLHWGSSLRRSLRFAMLDESSELSLHRRSAGVAGSKSKEQE